MKFGIILSIISVTFAGVVTEEIQNAKIKKEIQGLRSLNLRLIAEIQKLREEVAIWQSYYTDLEDPVAPTHTPSSHDLGSDVWSEIHTPYESEI